MGRAHPRGQRKFRRIEVDCDDFPGACQPRALHGGETDRTAANHHHGVAMRDSAEIERSADTRHDAAADQASAVERNFLRYRYRLLIGYDAVFAERSQEHQLLKRAPTVERRAAATIERHRLRPLAEIFLAQNRRVAVAIEAMPAIG